jgi:hypothetical protein
MLKLIGPLARRKFLSCSKIGVCETMCTDTTLTFDVVKENTLKSLSYCRFYCSEKKKNSELTKAKSSEVGTPKTFKHG